MGSSFKVPATRSVFTPGLTLTKGCTKQAWRDCYAPDGVPVDVSAFTIYLAIKDKATGVITTRAASPDPTSGTGWIKYQPIDEDVEADALELQWHIYDENDLHDVVPSASVINLKLIDGVPATLPDAGLPMDDGAGNIMDDGSGVTVTAD